MFRLPSETVDEINLDENLPDQYDEQVGGTINEGTQEDDITSHLKKPAKSDFSRQKKTDLLCYELSKLVDYPREQYSLNKYGLLV